MALVKPVVFQIVGFQNSGKTTFTLKLIEQLKNYQLQTVTIKHHGHGGKPDASMSKDTGKHLTSGALASIVEGGGRLLLQAEEIVCNLDDQVELMKFFKPEVILVEGYKKEHYPKLLLVRETSDIQLLEKVNNVVAVISWNDEIKEQVKEKWAGPSFLINEDTAIQWIIQYIQEQVQKKSV
ncbi:molybdopterin-guanine dinucleotide biosynthesis protein B [Neobacillus rhizosphaerae]|uniref:molybdopterin-guanine dinucleotide biosynthesis protein B n=1 Tax=Neobacillus rhizosphaerae TaxID=2880965 RepID=UPI003D2AD44B